MALGLVAANHAVLTAAGLWPRSRLLGPNLTRLAATSAARREIAITIDDGPDPEVTPRVLEILDRFGASATFFCIGERVSRHAGICREIIDAGHAIENHAQQAARPQLDTAGGHIRS
ncbi:MAG TPA: polysaccharide deacetylase family protein, partial [Rhodocyclaceae bacterium]|nr:polysaccharide deacetylase family protein [Rhodocyclaceae bacterium]